MANPFMTPLNAENKTNMTLGNIVSSFQRMLSMGSSPQQIQQVLLSKFPNLQNVAEEIQRSGMNPLDYATQKAMQKNINVNPAIQQMLSMVNQYK